MAKSGRHFLQIPGPTNVPDRVLRALSRPDDRSSRARVRRARERGVERAQGDLPDLVARHHLPGLRHGRVGSLARQHALARRQGPDVRDGPLRDAVERHRDADGPAGRFRRRRLASRRRPRRRLRKARRRSRPAQSKPSASSTTRRQRASSAASPTSGSRSTPRAIRRCCSSTRSPRSDRSSTATRRGAWTSRSAARRRG